MEKRNNPMRIAGSIAALLTLINTTALAGPPPGPPAEETVVLTGWLHVEGYTMSDVVIEVEVNGAYSTAHVSENGRFTVTLPAEADAKLRFEKPGHLPKEVLVDTHHATDGEPGQRVRRVKFAVIMELERRMAGLTYPGPVGSIGFDQGGGCLAVAHDRSLVKAKRQAVMVF
jgi:hypothetical protein